MLVNKVSPKNEVHILILICFLIVAEVTSFYSDMGRVYVVTQLKQQFCFAVIYKANSLGTAILESLHYDYSI